VFVAATNRVGLEDSIEFWGASFAFDPAGNLLHRASHHEESIAIVECNLDQIDVQRTYWPFLRDRRIDAYADLTRRWIDE
jgi:N-carbamoylputrescine amidase